METRAHYRADFEATEAGKTVYFAFRWFNSTGKPGLRSQIYSAVCPG